MGLLPELLEVSCIARIDRLKVVSLVGSCVPVCAASMQETVADCARIVRGFNPRIPDHTIPSCVLEQRQAPGRGGDGEIAKRWLEWPVGAVTMWSLAVFLLLPLNR